MDENNIINALTAYDGTQPSLEKTVSVLVDEIGPDWTDTSFEQLGNFPVELKEKLDHVFNYYASLMAWQEAETYLNQEEPLDGEMIEERLPILKHWLDFFGQPGQSLYQQLEERYKQEENTEDAPETDSDDSDAAPVSEEPPSEEQVEEVEPVVEEVAPQAPVNQEPVSQTEPSVMEDENVAPQTQEVPHPTEVENKQVDNPQPQTKMDSENKNVQDGNSPEEFAVHKAEREIVLLDSLQSWLSARCLQLGDIEVFAYPYYGMLVDLMRQVVKDIQAVLDLENQDLAAKYCSGGLDSLMRKKQAIEADIQTAVENCESDTTALIDKEMDLNKVKKALGDLDTSTEKEYLGPAPDGFELLDDKPIDEEAVKEQYEKLEEKAQENVQKQDISVIDEKKTSQNEQNGVQRKLSFSLKPKKG